MPLCIICQKKLDNIDDSGNQPDEGLAFTSFGHYGSRVFDPMDGTWLEVNVCDRCLGNAARNGAVLRGTSKKRPTKPTYRTWKP